MDYSYSTQKLAEMRSAIATALLGTCSSELASEFAGMWGQLTEHYEHGRARDPMPVFCCHRCDAPPSCLPTDIAMGFCGAGCGFGTGATYEMTAVELALYARIGANRRRASTPVEAENWARYQAGLRESVKHLRAAEAEHMTLQAVAEGSMPLQAALRALQARAQVAGGSLANLFSEEGWTGRAAELDEAPAPKTNR